MTLLNKTVRRLTVDEYGYGRRRRKTHCRLLRRADRGVFDA